MKTFLALLSMLVLLSCRRDKVEVFLIRMGDDSAVQSKGITTYLSGSLLNPRTLRLDLNRNGVYDLQVVSEIHVQAGSSPVPLLWIKTLHNGCFLRVNEQSDSVFLFQSYYLQNTPSGELVYFNVSRQSCRKETPLFVHTGFETQKHLVSIAEDEWLSFDDKFETGEFFLSEAESQTTVIDNTADTAVYNITEFKRDCRSFPEEVTSYIGFKLRTPDGFKLGWIEVLYSGENRLRIKDWVIQH